MPKISAYAQGLLARFQKASEYLSYEEDQGTSEAELVKARHEFRLAETRLKTYIRKLEKNDG